MGPNPCRDENEQARNEQEAERQFSNKASVFWKSKSAGTLKSEKRRDTSLAAMKIHVYEKGTLSWKHADVYNMKSAIYIA